MVLRNQRERGVGGGCDHRLLGLEPFVHEGLELGVYCHVTDLSFVVWQSQACTMQGLSTMVKFILKKHKRGLVQDLFTADLLKSPRRRFADFKDAWISRSFDEVFSFLKNNTLPRSEMTTAGGMIRNVHYGDVLIKYGDVLDCNRNQMPFLVGGNRSDDCRLLQDGDVVIADTAEDEAVGKAVELVGVDTKLIESGLHTIACRPKTPFAPRFLGYYLNSTAYRRQLLPLMQGIKVLSLSKSQLGKTQLLFPSNINEQKRIAELLAGIDAHIVVAQLHLDKMQSLKTGLLQQLFV